MTADAIDPGPSALEPLIRLIGQDFWRQRMTEIRDLASSGPRSGLAIRQRHSLELTIDKLRRPRDKALTQGERLVERIASEIQPIAESLSAAGRANLVEQVRTALTGRNTLVSIFHLIRTAMMQQARGFTVRFSGLEDGTPHDLLLQRNGATAEVACDVITAEEGRGVHRGAWFRLADRIDPDLQTWLAAHPGRYLLKMTLPQGLRGGLHDAEPDLTALAQVHERIRAMLRSATRQDHDEAIVLRLDPLLLAGAQAEDNGLISRLRREFGPEAHLSVTTAGNAVFVMAARAGQENEVAIAIRRRLGAIAPQRLTGENPGILAIFVEDTDKTEWRGLRERLELEGEARQFMTHRDARPVVAVSFASRLELFGLSAPDAAADGEIRFRNPNHPAAGLVALAPAVLSSM
ncbi:hypothetical protein [Rhodopila sp.]|uniref:hypothetical protein n=1 Tax=Rhodopila sp. TaxID=2480087 RepID=UPI002BAFFFCA|nr:hypothetical protein [Rhodopila sp.]HVZ10480.1 hypothetical protein [Rhodopila sp.]